MKKPTVKKSINVESTLSVLILALGTGYALYTFGTQMLAVGLIALYFLTKSIYKSFK